MPIARAASTLAGVDDFSGSLTRQILVFLITMKIAGILLVFDPAGYQAFDFPKSLFSHAIAWPMAVTVFAGFLRFGPGILPRTRLHLAVAGFALVNLVSALLAVNPYVAFFGDQDRYLGLTFVADMVVLYVATAVGFRSVKDFAGLVVALAAAGAFVLAYAGTQTAGLDPLVWINDPRKQPFATFGHPDILGHFLTIAFAVAAGIAVSAPLSSRRIRFAALAASLTCMGVAGIVAVRGTLLGIGAALLAMVAVGLRSRDWRAALRIIAPAILATGFLSWVVAITPLGERAAHTIEDAGSGRLSIYRSALSATWARPLFGYGPDSFGVAYPSYREPPPFGPPDPQTSAHDWVLQEAVTTGLVGLGALLILIASFAIANWRAIPRAPLLATPIFVVLAAYYVHALVAVGSISVDWLPWLCFGSIAAVTGETRPATTRRVASLVFPLLALVAVGGTLAPVGALQANRDANSARSNWTLGRTDSAIAAAEAALSRDRGRAEYWNWLGVTRDQAGLWRDSASAYQEAVARAPHEATYWDNLALARRAQALMDGDTRAGQAAVAAALRAFEIDPNVLRVNETLTDVAYEFGDFDLALRGAVRKAVLFDPGFGYRAFLASQRLSDLTSARRVLEDAVAVRDVAGLRLALAQIALRMNDRASAETNAVRALELMPGDRDALALLAQARR